MEGVLGDGLAGQDREQGPDPEGRAKEAAGKMSNDPGLAMEGKLERGTGHIKQAGEKMKDAGRNLFRW
jgi:uncharacterized protein YjbJ (UPF0337 family)